MPLHKHFGTEVTLGLVAASDQPPIHDDHSRSVKYDKAAYRPLFPAWHRSCGPLREPHTGRLKPPWHPGISLLLRNAGISVAILDLTAGELGTRGTPQDPKVEATAADRKALPAIDDAQVLLSVGVLRSRKPVRCRAAVRSLFPKNDRVGVPATVRSHLTRCGQRSVRIALQPFGLRRRPSRFEHDLRY
jgi:hypothetical protein